MEHKLQSRRQDGSRSCEGELHRSFFLPGGGNMNAVNAFGGNAGNMNDTGGNICPENELVAVLNMWFQWNELHGGNMSEVSEIF